MNIQCYVNVYDKTNYPIVFLDAVPFSDYADAVRYMEDINDGGIVYCPSTMASLYGDRILLVLSFVPNNFDAVSLHEASGEINQKSFSSSIEINRHDNDTGLDVH